MEVWKPIIGYEGTHMVSNLGRIKSNNKILNMRPNRGGYLLVSLVVDGDRKDFSPHRIVARAFVPGYRVGLQINHKDGNKTNNNADNLEWCTASKNMYHAYANGLASIKHCVDRHSKKVAQLLPTGGEVIKVWTSIREADKSGVAGRSHISRCCNGSPRDLTAGGFKWKFV